MPEHKVVCPYHLNERDELPIVNNTSLFYKGVLNGKLNKALKDEYSFDQLIEKACFCQSCIFRDQEKTEVPKKDVNFKTENCFDSLIEYTVNGSINMVFRSYAEIVGRNKGVIDKGGKPNIMLGIFIKNLNEGMNLIKKLKKPTGKLSDIPNDQIVLKPEGYNNAETVKWTINKFYDAVFNLVHVESFMKIYAQLLQYAKIAKTHMDLMVKPKQK